MLQYDKDEIKFNLSLAQISDILNYLNAEPEPALGGVIHCRTVCHNGNSHKLYYYDNTKLFKCFTDCSETFDIFSLVQRVKTLEENKEWPLPKAVQWVADFFGITGNDVEIDADKLEDWNILERYDNIKGIDINNKIVEYKIYDGKFLSHLPKARILPWERDGITQTAMNQFGIVYEPKTQCILIPHTNIEGNLIGIRQRTLIEEIAEKYGKYRPFKLGKQIYNHPLSFNLYGICNNKENIIRAKKAIVFESEKAVLQYESFMGRENNIAVACCGSSFIQYQAWLLMKLGVEEIIIGLDHDFTDISSPEAARIIKNLEKIHAKYGNFVKISIIWDKNNLTGYKDSPTDCGKDIFIQLYKERINLY